jgi:ParB-like chromosome segregation protein Spo0J
MTFHKIRPELDHLAVPVATLRPCPDNPNNGDVEAVAESLTVNGMYAPVIAWAETGEILAGHTRYEAVLTLGWSHIAALMISAGSRDEAMRILMVDNRSAQLARMDEGLLLGLLESLPDLAGTGYGDADVRRLEGLVSAPLDLGSQVAAVRCGFCGK